MKDIVSMLEYYDRDPHALDAPSIPRPIRDYLRAGLVSAELTVSRRSDPLFSLGSDKTYDCTNSTGEKKTLMLWGNTDGWGILEV